MPAQQITPCESPASGALRPSMATLVNRPDKVTQGSLQGPAQRPRAGSRRVGLAASARVISPRSGHRPFVDGVRRLTSTEGRVASLARQPAPGQGADEWEQF